jgi:glycerol uptake facilitator-like aquaporin
MWGAFMNPARATAPLLMTLVFGGLAIYWVGPVLGGVVAMQIWERLLLPKPGDVDG